MTDCYTCESIDHNGNDLVATMRRDDSSVVITNGTLITFDLVVGQKYEVILEHADLTFPPEGTIICPICNGEKVVANPNHGSADSPWMTCPECQGKGYLGEPKKEDK